MVAEDGLPALHPDEQEDHHKGCFRFMLISKGALAHIGNKVEQSEDKGEAAYIIEGGYPRRHKPEQVRRLFDYFGGTLAQVTSSLIFFHRPSQKPVCQIVPS
jgi:hypothetical protein